jgi:hypothetical protein
MKQLKITTLIVAIIATFASCNKENNIVKNNEAKDFKTANIKMKYGKEIIEFTVKHSPSTNKVEITGKGAARRNELVEKYNESVALFTSETEFTFYKNRNDFYAATFKDKTSNRLASNTNNQLGSNYNVLTTKIEFFQHSDYGNLLRTDYVYNHRRVPGQSWIFDAALNLQFTFYVKSNLSDDEGTDNYMPTPIVLNVPGVQNPWVGSGDNDSYSSLKVTNYNTLLNTDTNPYVTQPTNYNFFQLICFQDVNYGGKAIAFGNSTSSSSFININRLKDYRIYSQFCFACSWNDRFSSYKAFIY